MKHLVVVLSAGLFLAAGLSGCQTGSGGAPQAAGEGEMHATTPPTVDLDTKPVSFPAQEDLILLPMPRSLAFLEGPPVKADAAAPVVAVDAAAMPHAQGYVLVVGEGAAPKVTAHDAAGAFYARQTLKQLARQYPAGYLPRVRIEDWPDFPNRGVMLDVARDKVPTMDTLRMLADLFAEMKYNQIQLYTEHTFAYKDHETVWKDASPMTPAEIREFDAYCRERFIELVPNQNSFGHMGRWLEHPEYAHLAEKPGSGDLCPVDPGSVELLRGMYADLLPNFTSGQVNVGCDETWSLGKGRSQAAVDAQGEGRVYLSFLKEIHQIVSGHGKTMQFWGDIIMLHPELIPELPRPIIAMEWGYEADHPFADHGKKFAASGIPFYVVPGTSAWNSLLGRTDNALANLRNAAVNGLANGAIGFLTTDWGDNGHWQTLPVSLGPFAYGAAVSWCQAANLDLPLAKALDRQVFMDPTGNMGQAALDLGNAHTKTGVVIGNNTVYYALLLNALGGSPAKGPAKDLTVASAEAAQAMLRDALARVQDSAMARPDADLMKREFALNTDLALLALDLGRERILAGNVSTAGLPATVKSKLAEQLRDIIARHRAVWLERNRPGGLRESAGRMESLLAVLDR